MESSEIIENKVRIDPNDADKKYFTIINNQSTYTTILSVLDKSENCFSLYDFTPTQWNMFGFIDGQWSLGTKQHFERYHIKTSGKVFLTPDDFIEMIKYGKIPKIVKSKRINLTFKQSKMKLIKE
tara:strand:- start:11808 stop:12182 length:375 start_codon:yes stop_codon:yes gene_type:complete